MSHSPLPRRLGWAVLFLAALAGCSSPAAPTAQAPSVVSVTHGFEPAGGYGWQMTVSSDFSVRDVNHNGPGPDVQCVATVTAAQWNDLLAKVDAVRFFELKDSYVANDGTHFFARVVRTDTLKTVSWTGEAPLAALESHLIALRQGTLQWKGMAGDAESERYCTNRYWQRDLS